LLVGEGNLEQLHAAPVTEWLQGDEAARRRSDAAGSRYFPTNFNWLDPYPLSIGRDLHLAAGFSRSWRA
jgi:hypothetical protein